MTILPSKELLSEIFKREVSDITLINDTTVGYYFSDEPRARSPFWKIPYHEINIHELGNNCKEWALLKSYSIESCLSYKDLAKWLKIGIATILCVDSNNPLFGTKHYYISDTEPEAIFKACEWIMEQIK